MCTSVPDLPSPPKSRQYSIITMLTPQFLKVYAGTGRNFPPKIPVPVPACIYP